MFGRLYHDKQLVVLNNYILSGIQSVSLSTSFEKTPINILGLGHVSCPMTSIPQNSLNIERLLITTDPVIDITKGTGLASGIYVGNDSYFSFYSGSYINSYSLSCNVGGMVNSSFTINFYGNLETGAYTGVFKSGVQSGNIAQTVNIPTWASVQVTTDSYQSDRIVGFNYEVTLQKEPIYTIGARYPSEYYEKYPLRETLSLDIEVDKFKINEFKTQLCDNQHIESILVQINSQCGSSGLLSIDFSSGRLFSQEFSSQISNAAVIRLGYERYVNDSSLLSYSLTPSYVITGFADPCLTEQTQYSGIGFTAETQVDLYTGYNPSGLNYSPSGKNY